MPVGPLSRALAGILNEAYRASDFPSQTALGKAAGISQSQISKYLNADRSPTIEEVEAICKALDRDLVDVIRAARLASRGL